MNHQAIRFWLLRAPRPASLRLTAGSVVKAFAIAGQSWMGVARSVEAMQVELIEALDGAGNLIRAKRTADDDDDDDLSETTLAKSQLPAALPAVATDPETARFELFARLLVQATQHATEQARAGNEVAFAKLCEIAEIMGKRGEALERSLAATERLLHNARIENAEQAGELAAAQGGEGGLLNDLVGAVTQGMGMAKNGAPAPNGKA